MLRAASRATFVFGLLAFGTQAVLSFTSVSFSNVQQCNAFNIKFSGGQLPDALPLTLTILPFDAEPILIPLPINSWNVNTSVGAAITFIPLPAGATFLASVDDANGNGLGQVSDVMKVQSSSNDSCLPGPSTPSRFVSIEQGVTQCQEFNVTYDADIVTSPPSKLRAFTPRFSEFSVNIVDDNDDGDDDNDDGTNNQPGLSRYVMDGLHGFQVVMLYNDSAGHLWTSNLTTIGGDTTSSFKCFPKPDRSTNSGSSDDGNKTPVISNTMKSIIGAICGTVVGIVLLIFAILLRRRLLQKRKPQLEDAKGFRPNSMADSGNSVILSTDICLSGPASMEVFKQLSILEGKLPADTVQQVPLPPPNRNRASSFGFNTTMRMDRDVPSSPFSIATFFRDVPSMPLPGDSSSISVSSPRLPTIAGDHVDPPGTAKSGGNASFGMQRNIDVASNTQSSPRFANAGLRSSYGSGSTASTDRGIPRRPEQAAKKLQPYRLPGSF